MHFQSAGGGINQCSVSCLIDSKFGFPQKVNNNPNIFSNISGKMSQTIVLSNQKGSFKLLQKSRTVKDQNSLQRTGQKK